jgi:hypothetical protein
MSILATFTWNENLLINLLENSSNNAPDMSVSKVPRQTQAAARGPHADEVIGILPSRQSHDDTVQKINQNLDPLAEEIEEMAKIASADSGKAADHKQGQDGGMRRKN